MQFQARAGFAASPVQQPQLCKRWLWERLGSCPHIQLYLLVEVPGGEPLTDTIPSSPRGGKQMRNCHAWVQSCRSLSKLLPLYNLYSKHVLGDGNWHHPTSLLRGTNTAHCVHVAARMQAAFKELLGSGCPSFKKETLKILPDQGVSSGGSDQIMLAHQKCWCSNTQCPDLVPAELEPPWVCLRVPGGILQGTCSSTVLNLGLHHGSSKDNLRAAL